MRLHQRLIHPIVIVFVCVAALLSFRCKDNCTGQPAPLIANPAHVRFIHAVTDAPAVDLLFDSTTIVSGATFNTYTATTACYRDCPTTGTRTLSARLTGTSLTVVSSQATLLNGEYYTVVLINTRAAARLLVLRDTLTTPAPDSARIRVIHAVPDLPSMDVSLAGTTISRNIMFGSSSGYLTVHRLLPAPIGTDTGSFVAWRSGSPRDVVVEMQSGHVAIPGQNVLTLIVLGKISPNGTEPLATVTVFQDNFASTRGYGDAVLLSELGAVRLFDGASDSVDRMDLLVYNSVSQGGMPPDWRPDFPGQDRVKRILNDSMSSYFFLGFSGFKKNAKGQYVMPLMAVRHEWNEGFADSVVVDPFQANDRVTCAVVGYALPHKMLILRDTMSTPPAGSAAIRFVNGCPDSLEQLTLASSGSTLFANTPYRGITGSTSVPAGNTTLTVRPTSSAPIQLTTPLLDGHTYTAFAIGRIADGTLRLKVFEK